MIHALLLAPPLLLWGAWALTLMAQARSASRYQPAGGSWTAEASVVTAVYDTDPKLFRRAVASWIDNGVAQVIAVIDAKNPACADAFRTLERENPACALEIIVTDKPGKRPAIVDGCAKATSPIVVLADADTEWSPTFLREVLKPFADPSIGACSGYDEVIRPRTLAQFAYATSLRFSCSLLQKDTIARGQVLTCMSGRSSAYRREILLPAVGGLLTETFRGKRYKSGDDLYLGQAVLSAGYKTAYQSSARCWTIAAREMSTYWHQITRWNRNTFRGRIMGYGAGANPPEPLHVTARIYVRLLVHLSTPVFFAVYAAFALPGAVITLAAVAYAVSAFALRLSGNPLATALRLAPAFIFGQSLGGYGALFAYFTVEEDGWLTYSRDEQFREQPHAKHWASRAMYAGLLFGMVAIVVAYVAAVLAIA